ncbi:MAG: helix-turn-helix transcriptional regulator [Nevskia sp.]|nr:helix-turn-helix transcriptional regulator [Nevskia sp.]
MAGREQLFLDAARELVREEGVLNVQMARIAEKCDYAVGTLYQHFTSKEDLLIALATCNIQQRVEMFRRVAEWKAPTRDRMAGIAVADLVFVRRYPEHFRLAQFAFTDVVWHAASAQRRQVALAAGKPLGAICASIVNEAVECGDVQLKGLNPSELTLGPWALTLGVHTVVHLDGLLEQHEVREPYRLLLRHIHNLLNGLDWKPLFDPSDIAELERRMGQLCREVFNDQPCA